jgi:hypothetical protein
MSDLAERLRTLELPPLPGSGQTAKRHHMLIETARDNLSLARLAEAHFDALSILAEANQVAASRAVYGVWASENPRQAIEIRNGKLYGKKSFCTGAGLLDRALVTATEPEAALLDIDLRAYANTISIDTCGWITPAFAETSTATVTFSGTPFAPEDMLGPPCWYLDRPGFWSGALGPAACWAGGAIGLVDWARMQNRKDAHTLAHLGALEADAWLLRASLGQAGEDIDSDPSNTVANHRLALAVRHLVESTCADILTRLGRAYGPYPLAFEPTISRRFSEVELYIRQCHAERDLENLGRLVGS